MKKPYYVVPKVAGRAAQFCVFGVAGPDKEPYERLLRLGDAERLAAQLNGEKVEPRVRVDHLSGCATAPCGCLED